MAQAVHDCSLILQGPNRPVVVARRLAREYLAVGKPLHLEDTAEATRTKREASGVATGLEVLVLDPGEGIVYGSPCARGVGTLHGGTGTGSNREAECLQRVGRLRGCLRRE